MKMNLNNSYKNMKCFELKKIALAEFERGTLPCRSIAVPLELRGKQIKI